MITLQTYMPSIADSIQRGAHRVGDALGHAYLDATRVPVFGLVIKAVKNILVLPFKVARGCFVTLKGFILDKINARNEGRNSMTNYVSTEDRTGSQTNLC